MNIGFFQNVFLNFINSFQALADSSKKRSPVGAYLLGPPTPTPSVQANYFETLSLSNFYRLFETLVYWI